MNSMNAELNILRASVSDLERELANLEAEVIDLEREMQDFKKRYDRVVKPVEDKLKTIQKMIDEIETDRFKSSYAPPATNEYSPYTETWQPPTGYVSVEEQFRRAWGKSGSTDTFSPGGSGGTGRLGSGSNDSGTGRLGLPQPAGAESSEKSQPDTLKTIYRQLVRRYHPDLTTDPAERQRRNQMMVEINEAYSKKDRKALEILAGQKSTGGTQPLAMLQIKQLRQLQQQLTRRVHELRDQRDDLLHGEMAKLKLEYKLAKGRGRDLLRERARELEREYNASLDRLDRLRGSH